MSRYRSYGQLDEEAVSDGDGGFIGVDEREPGLVAASYVNRAVNYTFRNKVAEPRLGCVPLCWMNGEGLTWPWNFPVSFEYPRPIAANVIAGAVFSDPDGFEWIIVAANPAGSGGTQVFAAREGFKPQLLSVPAGEDDARLLDCSFTQCFNKLIWFRGKSRAPLELGRVRDGFQSITQADSPVDANQPYNPGPTDNTIPIPNALSGVFLQNRLFVPHSRDLVLASDFLNYTRYYQWNDFRINEGSADELVGLYKLGTQSMVCFKTNSIHLVNNVQGDLSALSQEAVTMEFGLAARKGVCGTGKDVWFMSQRGITSVGLVLDNRTQLQERTWTDALSETWGRINWLYAYKAAAVFFDGYILFAVPLDDAEVVNGAGTYSGVNNAVLVWDTFNQAWAGVHTGPNLMVREWLQFTWQGKRRLGYLSEDGVIYLYGFTFEDQARPGAAVSAGEERVATAEGQTIIPIYTELVSRGFTFVPNDSSAEVRRSQGAEMKRFSWVRVSVSTWDPSYSVSVLVDGVAEEDVAGSGVTRSRSDWLNRWGAAGWDESNPNDDHGAEGRGDYSVNCSTGPGPDGPEGTPILLGSGVNCEGHQEAVHRARVNREGRLAQVKIVNVQGRCGVNAVAMSGRAGRRRAGVMV